MSLRSSLWRYLGLLAVAALAAGVFAGPASAKKLSAKQRAAITKSLRKQVKKNPGVVNRKSFIKRASLVNFKLPVTLRLRGAGSNSNPNNATVDLGASLGTREVDLGGSLAAEITFHDSYDGGALGNVDLSILESSTKKLTSTSIPLLWNSQVSAGRYDANSLQDSLSATGLSGLANSLTTGCGNFTGNAPVPFGTGLLPSYPTVTTGLPGYPYYDAGAPSTTAVAGFLPVTPGVDSIDKVVAGKVPGNDNIVGGSLTPFPSGSSAPSGFAPTPQDTVLRTNALKLGIAHPGTAVTQSDSSTNGPQGSQNIVIGKSGGQANLFGAIPGKGYGIDVTVNLATKINSILRVVDQDAFGSPLMTGNPYPAGIFNCRQIWTGGVQNYIPSVRLTGNLKIAPGLTSDGHLRIAKATVSSYSPTQFAVAACLAPYAGVAAEQQNSDINPTPASAKIPGFTSPTQGAVVPTSALPADTGTARPAPTQDCNATPTGLLASSAQPSSTVNSLTGTNNLADGFSTANDGSKVSVGADLNVTGVSLDVLVGDI